MNYYNEIKNEIWNAVRSNLSWTHCRELLLLNDKNEIRYYIKIVNEQNIGYRQEKIYVLKSK